MIISDLNHLEAISEEMNIQGGNSAYYDGIVQAIADSAAAADAIGPITQTLTIAQTGAVAGLFSKSVAISSSYAAG